MKYLYAILACLALAAPAAGQAYGVKYDAQAFTIHLPQDQDKAYITLIGNPADPRFAAVRQWFETNDNLRTLKAGSHYTELATDSTLYRERYASTAPKTLPAVRVQAADGTVLNDFSPLPLTAEALTRGIGNCFRQTPDSTPSATPLPTPPADHRPYILLALLIAAGALAGLVQSFRTRTPKGTA